MALNEHDGSAPERDARLDRLYAQAGREEPPARLDAAIQAAARRAVGARPQPIGARLRRWGVPISIAAVVVVSVSLVTLMREEGAGRLEESYPPAPAAPKAIAPAPAEPTGAASSAGDSPGSRQLVAPSGVARKPAEEAADAVPRAPPEAEKAAARQAAPGQEVLGKKKAETPAADAPHEPAAAMRSAPLRADQRPMASSIEARERSLTDDQFNSLLKELEKAAPDTWLERIERLRREGRHVDADALLAEFKKRFPGHPVTRQDIEPAR
jgi:hypothetical protein